MTVVEKQQMPAQHMVEGAVFELQPGQAVGSITTRGETCPVVREEAIPRVGSLRLPGSSRPHLAPQVATTVRVEVEARFEVAPRAIMHRRVAKAVERIDGHHIDPGQRRLRSEGGRSRADIQHALADEIGNLEAKGGFVVNQAAAEKRDASKIRSRWFDNR